MNLTRLQIFTIVTYLKGIAIIMVVFLHLDLGFGNQDFDKLNLILRPFRMPVFIFASGFLYYYVTKSKYPVYSNFIVEKFKRLIVPMLFIKFLYALVRMTGAGFLTLRHENSLSNLISILSDIFIFPLHNQNAYFLWFVYTLFLIFAIVHLFADKLNWLLVIGLIIFFFPFPEIFGLHKINELFLFFCLGGLSHNLIKKVQIRENTKPIALGSFFVSVLICVGLTIPEKLNGFENYFIYLIQSLFGVVAVVSISTFMTLSKRNVFVVNLRLIGTFSATIYFLHTFCYRFFLFIASILKLEIHHYTWILIILSLINGIYGSVLIDKYLISKSRIAGLLFLGRKSNIHLYSLLRAINIKKYKFLNILHFYQKYH